VGRREKSHSGKLCQSSRTAQAARGCTRPITCCADLADFFIRFASLLPRGNLPFAAGLLCCCGNPRPLFCDRVAVPPEVACPGEAPVPPLSRKRAQAELVASCASGGICAMKVPSREPPHPTRKISPSRRCI
jgi:hypothetical protein